MWMLPAAIEATTIKRDGRAADAATDETKAAVESYTVGDQAKAT